MTIAVLSVVAAVTVHRDAVSCKAGGWKLRHCATLRSCPAITKALARLSIPTATFLSLQLPLILALQIHQAPRAANFKFAQASFVAVVLIAFDIRSTARGVLCSSLAILSNVYLHCRKRAALQSSGHIGGSGHGRLNPSEPAAFSCLSNGETLL